MLQDLEIGSISGVCEVTDSRASAAAPDSAPDLLIEVPHGATTSAEYHTACRRLSGTLPDDLEAFFFVNTDVGAPECAARVARILAAPAENSRRTLIVRGLVPRTLIDFNRVVGAARDAALFNPAVPPYVEDRADIERLESSHRAYHDLVERAYDFVCGTGGVALMLHTYAPRSVKIETLDRTIVDRLREAYEPERYAAWPERPDVDLITETDDGASLANASLVDALKRRYAEIGIRVAENATYRLHPATMGHRYATRHAGRVLCIELNRALLAEPFDPFREMHIGDSAAERMSLPLAGAIAEALES